MDGASPIPTLKFCDESIRLGGTCISDAHGLTWFEVEDI